MHGDNTGGMIGQGESHIANEALLLCVRIPKSGSTSLDGMLSASGRTVIDIPTLEDFDGKVSRFQRLRFQRTLRRNLLRAFGTPSVQGAFDAVNARARRGDIISGGHNLFPTLSAGLTLPMKMIVLMRDPYARALSEYNYARQSFNKKRFGPRIDKGILPKLAGKWDFAGFLDGLLEYGDAYSSLASRLIGWNGQADLAAYFGEHVLHAGIIEGREAFARGGFRRSLVFRSNFRMRIERATPAAMILALRRAPRSRV